MSTLHKRWFEALLACALGTAVGLLSDSARSANVTIDEAEIPGGPAYLLDRRLWQS